MGVIASFGFDVFATILKGLSALIERYPWVAMLLTLSPALPALVAGAFASALLFALMGLAAVVAMAINNDAGLIIWCAAWAFSMVQAIATVRRRRARRPARGISAQTEAPR